MHSVDVARAVLTGTGRMPGAPDGAALTAGRVLYGGDDHRRAR